MGIVLGVQAVEGRRVVSRFLIGMASEPVELFASGIARSTPLAPEVLAKFVWASRVILVVVGRGEHPTRARLPLMPPSVVRMAKLTLKCLLAEVPLDAGCPPAATANLFASASCSRRVGETATAAAAQEGAGNSPTAWQHG